MKKTSLLILLLLSLHAFGQQKIYYTSGKKLNKVPQSTTEQTNYTYKLIPSGENTFGYDVFADNILIFHQVQMPGKATGIGFTNREDAEKVAQCVIMKLKHPEKE